MEEEVVIAESKTSNLKGKKDSNLNFNHADHSHNRRADAINIFTVQVQSSSPANL